MARVPVPPLHTPMFGPLGGTFRQLGAWLYPGKSAPWSEWFDALTKLLNSVFVDGFVTSDRISDDAITSTKIADNAIATPHLQANAVVAGKIAANAVTADTIAANAVTASKIDVDELSAISVNAGTITAGTFIGTTFKTAVSPNARIEIDTADGFRAWDSGNVLWLQILGLEGRVRAANISSILGGGPLMITGTPDQASALLLQSRASTGAGRRNTIGFSDNASPAIIFGVADNLYATMTPAAMTFEAGVDIKLANGRGVLFGTTAAISGSSSGTDNVEIYTASTLRCRWDQTEDATTTPMLLLGDGSVRRVKIDNVDLGSGAKRYLYLE